MKKGSKENNGKNTGVDYAYNPDHVYSEEERTEHKKILEERWAFKDKARQKLLNSDEYKQFAKLAKSKEVDDLLRAVFDRFATFKRRDHSFFRLKNFEEDLEIDAMGGPTFDTNLELSDDATVPIMHTQVSIKRDWGPNEYFGFSFVSMMIVRKPEELDSDIEIKQWIEVGTPSWRFDGIHRSRCGRFDSFEQFRKRVERQLAVCSNFEDFYNNLYWVDN